MFEPFAIEKKLIKLQQQNRWRQQYTLNSAQGSIITIAGNSYINFSSNDYLGMANHPGVKEALTKAIEEFGIGSGASHLVSGHQYPHEVLATALANWLGYPKVLLFSSGYLANLALLSTFMSRHDAIFADRLIHASLIDGCLLAGAKLYRFRHGDSEHLTQLMHQNYTKQHAMVITDGVFSMDGDVAPLKPLVSIAQENNALLIVDDAHGIGVLGLTGRGSLELCGLTSEEVPFLVGTFGKALGTSGAFIATQVEYSEYLLQRARSYIYTTALPPAMAAATLASLRYTQEDPERRTRLMQVVKYFRYAAKGLNLPLANSLTPIQPVILGSAETALTVQNQLRARGFWVVAIRPPTVPVGSARLRITLSATHTEQQIDRLLHDLSLILENHEIGS